jgi:lysophospholipase L1-like esterase
MRGAIAILIASSARPGPSSCAPIVLLAMAVAASDCALVCTMRSPSVEQAVREPQRLGYYEGLTDVARQLPGRTGSRPPANWMPFGGAETGIVREVSSYLRWTMKPNLDLRWNGTVFRTNRLGLRSPEIELKKPAGTYRIVVLGSSNTMGYGVDNDQMYPHLLERWLNDWLGPSHRVEVVNLAVSGDSPSRRLCRLQQEVRRFSPDWVLCDVSPFDPWLEDRHIHSVLQRGLPIPFAFVQEAVDRTGVTPADGFDAFRERFRGESERMFEDVYAGWSAEAKRIGVPLTLVILPRSDSKAKSTRLRRYILSLAERHGLDYLDVSDAFDALDVDDFRLSGWDHHPSARGHRAIFEAIRGALSSRGYLPGFPPRAETRHRPVPRP